MKKHTLARRENTQGNNSPTQVHLQCISGAWGIRKDNGTDVHHEFIQKREIHVIQGTCKDLVNKGHSCSHLRA